MAETKHIIEPERFGTWIAVTFVIALLALVVALVAVQRTNDLTANTQAEILLLNQKIESSQTAAPAAEPAAPEAAAE